MEENNNKNAKTVDFSKEDACDLNPSKKCDNCFKCLESDKNYKVIKITKIIKDE